MSPYSTMVAPSSRTRRRRTELMRRDIVRTPDETEGPREPGKQCAERQRTGLTQVKAMQLWICELRGDWPRPMWRSGGLLIDPLVLCLTPTQVSDGLRLRKPSQPPNYSAEFFCRRNGPILTIVSIVSSMWRVWVCFAGWVIQMDPKKPRHATSSVCGVISSGLL